MSTCFDIYTLAGDGCAVIWTYPSQVHPQPSGGGGGGHPWREISEDKYREYPRIRNTDDEDVAVLIALGLM